MRVSDQVEPGTEALRAKCRWGDYRREEADENGGRKTARWRRAQREVACSVPLTESPPIRLPDADGLGLARQIRETQIRGETGDRKVLAVSLFLVNRRSPSEEEFDDEAMALFRQRQHSKNLGKIRVARTADQQAVRLLTVLFRVWSERSAASRLLRRSEYSRPRRAARSHPDPFPMWRRRSKVSPTNRQWL